jgi:hypothetical protein
MGTTPYLALGSAEQWAAGAAWFTAAVAVAAGVIALRQVTEARRLREQQAQPYVVTYMEPNAATPHIIDLVVRNFGTTAAYNVRLHVEPAVMRSAQGGENEPVWIFDTLPVLVPTQEWRTMWDFGPSRFESGLPDRHRAEVHFQDAKGRELGPLVAHLDWGAFKGRRWVTVYGVHDAAKALRDISSTLKKWQEGTRGLKVFVRSGDAKDERDRQEILQWQEQQRAAQSDQDSEPSERKGNDEH